jgi:hypothetical protein
LDESKGAGTGYDLLILDINANGDLSDDPVIEAQTEISLPAGPSGFEQRLFKPISIPLEKGKASQSLTFSVQTYIHNRQQIGISKGGEFLGQANLAPACYLEALVQLGAMSEKIGIVDANANARFGDKAQCQEVASGASKYRYFHSFDVVLRDRDGSGQFEKDLCDTESEAFSSVLYFAGNPYSVALADDLSAIRLEPYSGPLGEITAENLDQVRVLTLGWQGEGGQWEVITPQPQQGKIKAPAGSYALSQAVLMGKNSQGVIVMAKGYNRGNGQPIQVAAGQAVALRCGAPLELRVKTDNQTGASGGFLQALANVFTAAPKAESVTINVEVIGAGDEAYSIFARGPNLTERLNAPKFRVLGADGKVVASGQLEYG